jgi:RNA-directed DNA polymerase
MGLVVNREKTRVVNLKEPRTSLDFLGYTFRFDRDRHGGTRRYLNLAPSAKALAREREALRQMTGPEQSHTPLPELIQGINRHLKGWGNYFSPGYPRKARRQINAYVRQRLRHHLQRRSQRGHRPPANQSFYAHLNQTGLICL